jgi:hypothetical protein
MASRMDAHTNEEATDHHRYRHHASGIDTLVLDRPRLHSDQLKGLRPTIFTLSLSVMALGIVALAIGMKSTLPT